MMCFVWVDISRLNPPWKVIKVIVPLLRINSSIAALCCLVNTSQHAACECLCSFSHLQRVVSIFFLSRDH